MVALLLALITFVCSASEQNPQKIYGMNWLWENSIFSTKYHNSEVSFAIAFRNAIPHHIPEKFHHLFNSQKSNNETILIYTYGAPFEILSFPNIESDHSERSHYNPDYHVHTPLIQNNAEPQNISIKKLRKIMQEKSIAWYTGAGISAYVVPTMATLETSLGIIGATQDEKSINLTSTVLEKPAHIATIMHSFYEQCLHGKPTIAHSAIADYTQQKNCIVFTENLDMLHEHAGTNPTRIQDPALFKQNITAEKLQSIDAIICVGLSHDDRGLLAYYKQHNPQGIIIALCLDKPTYLDDNDYFLARDAQEIVPKLVQL